MIFCRRTGWAGLGAVYVIVGRIVEGEVILMLAEGLLEQLHGHSLGVVGILDDAGDHESGGNAGQHAQR